ncbi:16S rRNA (uracil(1498)-N(3))-methyltransferase [Verrucomicrobiaceae bacterium R5-34]|uniref:Ribosomal RNA small subunit methyltransferase E n=1 Tax=Oceaniferula flava TaxID=2800421 RepID=A0AAE2SBG0_9BACT|nr:16S rRNA (uracil(1498)-N(3))-methyltransferase [Oceaniferula flavus]MBK1830073.1 16S rRNA (uracil(1498)-N(3))-methyltransferase [Verrucomicrobiaceae bacterium R5-34]MBK1855080.1 16S rRNA (uracil(1498)-N(3))-methyltransferase [Oceaniferula flavus]MBM1136386.1 16S rRNA (uracil(1498)-N(3))-methyltransferase [Oceaniferula flavus]
MNRYYLPSAQWEAGCLTLTGDEARHCARVMRASEGDEIEIFDGAGKSAVCIIDNVRREEVRCRISQENETPAPSMPVTLCQSIPKGGNMELIVQKSVELGVNAIQPLITARTVARPDALAKKREKWQRIALEACKQCGQNHLPEILEPRTFSSWIEQLEPFATAVIAALDPAAVHFRSHLEQTPLSGSIGLLVGPEGDFTPEEYQQAYQQGFQPISFGSIVMRVETASIYGLSLIQHERSFALGV